MKPMLAAKTDGRGLAFPKLLSPKLDGVRCLIINGVAMSRSLKPIPNLHVQKLFSRSDLDGLDGELVVGEPVGDGVFNRTSSGVMSVDGEPDVRYHVFDYFIDPRLPFERRLSTAATRARRKAYVELVEHSAVISETDLASWEEHYVYAGYEGIMLRDPAGPYKHGRSTEKEGWLLKMKRFEDAEAVVIGIEQLMENRNEAKTNELGVMRRSSHKAGKVAKSMLGALKVRDMKTGVEFDIGTGFSADQRALLYQWGTSLFGKVVKYRCQPFGKKERPRFPVFLGFRDARDM